MSNMNNFNSSTPDALSSSRAIMGSGHDMEFRRKDGEEEHGDPICLQKNSTTVQGASNTFSDKPQWLPGANNSNDIKRTHLINHNNAGRVMFHIFDELSTKEEKKEENEGKKEEKDEGKKEDKNEGKKEENNEEKKGKKEKKTKKKGKRLRSHGTKDVFKSAPGPANKLDDPRTNQQLQNTPNMREHVLDGKSQKNNSSLVRSIRHNGEQRALGYDSSGQRFVSFPTKSGWNDTSKLRDVGLRELCRNESLDVSSQAEAQYSDQHALNQCVNETKDAILPELHNLPDYICRQLEENNRFGFHQVTNKDSLGFIDAEYTEYLNEVFGITGVQPVFIDHYGLVIWLLDKDGIMYQWNEMERSLRYMGKDLIDGLTNHFIYPGNLCEVMEDTGERIPVEEFKRKMQERAKKIWDSRIIL
uniref:Uncharacterized protein n=1 Tax=Anthurium amnicola TaxID=1678845 RepID=A0A1D1Z470_9ARAE